MQVTSHPVRVKIRGRTSMAWDICQIPQKKQPDVSIPATRPTDQAPPSLPLVPLPRHPLQPSPRPRPRPRTTDANSPPRTLSSRSSAAPVPVRTGMGDACTAGLNGMTLKRLLPWV